MPLRLPAVRAALSCLAAAALLSSAVPACAADFTDSAGRRVVLPDHMRRVMPAEPNAEVLVFVLAPEKLVGPRRAAGRSTRPGSFGWGSRSTPEGMANAARQLRPDLIVDAGAVTPERAAFADQVTQLSGIPYILVEDSFARMPKVLRTTGAILGAAERHTRDLWLYAEHAIAGLRGRLLIRPADARPHVYFARGADGLTTALPGSPAGEAIDAAGAINVAGALGRGAEATISREQLLGWDPQIIIAEQRSSYDSLRRDPTLRRLAAVRNKRVYLEPSSPFGWIGDPSGVNRLIGLYWLSSLFYPDATEEDLRATACDFYDKFYRIKLTNAQMEAMVRPAGAPPVEVPNPVGEPLVGLGAAPPSTLPPGSRGALSQVPVVPSAAPAAAIEAPGSAPSAACTAPGGPSPYLSPASTPEASPAETLPQGVPPPGRRGRPVGLAAPPEGRLAYQYQTRP